MRWVMAIRGKKREGSLKRVERSLMVIGICHWMGTDKIRSFKVMSMTRTMLNGAMAPVHHNLFIRSLCLANIPCCGVNFT